MKKLSDEELAKKIHDYFAETDSKSSVPHMPEYLGRMAARNAKDYNPQVDEFLIPDLFIIIHHRIKPVVLTDEQKTIIAKQFSTCSTMKSVYKVLDRITKHINLAFFNFK